MTDEFQVGILIKPHGLKGEAKVKVTSDDPRRFESLKEVTIRGKKGDLEAGIERVRYFKNLAIVKFRDIDRVEDIEGLAGSEIVIPRSEALPLGENEYYVCDLIGCRVEDESGNAIGELYDVRQTGANDVYYVRDDKDNEILLPAIKDCILNVDIENRLITVHMLKGLI